MRKLILNEPSSTAALEDDKESIASSSLSDVKPAVFLPPRSSSPSIRSASASPAPGLKRKNTPTARKRSSGKGHLVSSDEDYVAQSIAPIAPSIAPDVASANECIPDTDIFKRVQGYRNEAGPDVMSTKMRDQIYDFVSVCTAYERLGFNPNECFEFGTPKDINRIFTHFKDKHPNYQPSDLKGTFIGSRDQFMSILHKKFLATHGVQCSLQMFANSLEGLIERRPASIRGWASCLSCASAEIKFECLINQGILDFNGDFDDIWMDDKNLSAVYESLDRIRNSKLTIPLHLWNKSTKGYFSKAFRTETQAVSHIVKGLITELNQLEPHIKQVEGKYDVIRACLDRVSQHRNEVMLHIVWAETPKVYYRSVMQNVAADCVVSQLNGYVWTHDRRYDFTSLSDAKDHGTGAFWAHMEQPFADLVKAGCDKFYVVTDPNVAQFKNKIHFYYINEFAVRYNIEIRWIYSPTYHTHLTADFYACNTKYLIEKISYQLAETQNNTDRTAKDIIRMLRPHTSSTLYLVPYGEVAEKTTSIPNLPGIIRTRTFEEILISPGKFFVKLSSLHDYWTKVLILF